MKTMKAEIIDRRGRRHLIPCARLVDNVMIDPVLPADFESCPNQLRKGRNLAMWDIVFIRTHEDCSPAFVGHWGGAVRYDVRRLDGGAWDRSTNHGQFGSLTGALNHAKTLFMNQPDTPGFLGDEKPANAPARPAAAQPAADFRVLKATMSGMEFGAVQWAAKRCLRAAANGKLGAIPLADFLREAVLEKLRGIVRVEIEAGRKVPPDIAAVIDRMR